jgi:hypothetical protein
MEQKYREKDKEIKNKEKIKQYPVLVVFILSAILGTCTSELIGRNKTCLSVAETDVATLLIPKPVIARDSEPVSALSLPCDPFPLFRYGISIVRALDYAKGREYDFHESVHRDTTMKITTQHALYRLIYYSKSAVHVSGDVFTHHREHLTVFTVSRSIHPSCCQPPTQ